MRWAGLALLPVAAVAGYLLWPGRGDPVVSEPSALPVVEVRRTDLSSTVELSGTLGFGATRQVLGVGAGRITWLPAAGAVLRRGDRAYGVDGRPVPLLYGATPLWRELGPGVTDGYDVLELERNLTALGYSGFTVDRDFTAATAEAIRDWQEDRGRTRTGVIAPGDLLMQPGAIRVTEVRALLSAPVGGTIYAVTGTRRQVTVDVPVSQARQVARTGATARVTLPGGATASGTITTVGRVATASKTREATLTVTVALPASGGADAFDGAPVTVGLRGAVRKGVLAVPINALLGSAEGEYSVETVDAAGTVTSVPVELGIFAGDEVEVTGALTPGAKVRVPRT